MRRHREQSGARALAASLLAVLLCCTGVARASVAVLVEEPYGNFAHINPAGHSAVYLDHVCAASPIKLRPCNEGELGVVISRYRDVGGYDWLAMPLVAYLYAVDSPEDVPANIDPAAEARLRDEYRKKYLTAVAPNGPDGTTPPGNWYELVGSAYDRTLYGFQVKTTTEQDAGFIAMFNDRRNVQRYNGPFRNCADFARVTVNRFYPRAVKRNFLADLGITTPKQVAHALSKFGERHPEVGLTTFVVPQVPGSLPRSRRVKGVTECLLTCPRYALPIAAVSPPATALMFVAYMHHGRFSMPKDAAVLSMTSLSVARDIESPATEEDLPAPATVVKTSFEAASMSLLNSEQ